MVGNAGAGGGVMGLAVDALDLVMRQQLRLAVWPWVVSSALIGQLLTGVLVIVNICRSVAYALLVLDVCLLTAYAVWLTVRLVSDRRKLAELRARIRDCEARLGLESAHAG